MQIESVGSIAGPPTEIDRATLSELLSCPVSINHDGHFIGKPGTRLYATDALVLKRPCDESMSATQAIQWCQKQLERERRIRGYHPARTWIAFCKHQHWAVANITPRLPTLEQTLLGPLPSHHKVLLLKSMFSCFFNTYQNSDYRQDEGLSNYVVDGDDVWYIDDDIYGHDKLMAFSVSLGTFFRTLDWLNATSAYYLGRQLRKMISRVDSTLIESVHKVFADAFLPDHKEKVRRTFMQGLSARQNRRTPALPKRLAILADIHANLPALEAVLADCERRNLTSGLVLGDIVGYGPDPAECVERIQSTGFHVLMGNHDLAASGAQKAPGLSRAASWSAPWTYQTLGNHHRQWLHDLPRYFQDDNLYAIHGAPQDPTFMNAYVYARTADSNLEYMQSRGIRLCLHGHSHLPGIWRKNQQGEAIFSRPRHWTIDMDNETLICPGSVGQPRNDDCGAQYLILDTETRSAEFVSVPYNHAAMIRRMHNLGFPDYVIRTMGDQGSS